MDECVVEVYCRLDEIDVLADVLGYGVRFTACTNQRHVVSSVTKKRGVEDLHALICSTPLSCSNT